MSAAIVHLPVASGIRLAVRRWLPARPGPMPVLCVHGLASNSLLWAGAAARLAELGHPSAAVDLRGHGLSDKPDDGYAMHHVAGDVVSVLDALGWNRAVLAGQSWGGNVVIEAAARHGDRVAGAVAVDGGFIDLSTKFPRWQDCAEKLRPPPLIGTPARRLRAALVASHPGWPTEAVAAMMGCFEERSDGSVAPWLTLERHMQVLRGLWEHRPSEVMARIVAPVLLVPADSGAEPWVIDKRAAVDHALTRLHDGAVQWIRGDHDLHLQFPDDVAALIHRWTLENGLTEEINSTGGGPTGDNDRATNDRATSERATIDRSTT